MLLKKITLQNIRSYKQQEIEFTKGSTLLSGDIGSGKTSILLGIEFALFGLQPGQRGSALLRNDQEQGGVIMEFDIDEKEITVERTLKKAKTISQDYCAITINGEKKEISVTELKNKILDLLNYPKEFSRKQNILYKFTVYTPQEEMKQIILQDPETRVNTLRHVFGIDKYKKILENTSVVISKIREEKRMKEGFTANLEQDKIEIISKEDELKKKHFDLTFVEKELLVKTEKRKQIQKEQEEISRKIQEKNKLQQEIEKTKIIISNKKDAVAENKKVTDEIKKQINELNKFSFDESKISQLEQEIISKKKEKEILDSKNLEIASQITSINLKNQEAKNLEQKMSNLEICPTCLQNVDALYRANILNKSHSDISENNKKLENLEQDKQLIFKKTSEIRDKINSVEKEISNLKILRIKLQGIQEKQMRLEVIRKSNVLIEKDIELLAGHTKTLQSSVFELNKFDSLFEANQKELESASNNERMSEIKLAELKKEIYMFSVQIKELKQQIKKTEEIRMQLNHLTKLETWLSKNFMPVVASIEKNVMVKLKSEFSKLFAEWFCMLVSDSFDIQLSDDFTPIIKYQDYEIDYTYLSGGERTAIALAYRLSLNQVINSLLSKIKTRDIVILDEPTDGFSDQQLDKMRDVLQDLNVNQLIIVSHEQKIEGFVEKIIRFKKEGGVSRKES